MPAREADLRAVEPTTASEPQPTTDRKDEAIADKGCCDGVEDGSLGGDKSNSSPEALDLTIDYVSVLREIDSLPPHSSHSILNRAFRVDEDESEFRRMIASTDDIFVASRKGRTKKDEREPVNCPCGKQVQQRQRTKRVCPFSFN